MDAARFDELLRALSMMPSRRAITRVAFGATLAGQLGALGLSLADARKRRKKEKEKVQGRHEEMRQDVHCQHSLLFEP